MAGRTEGAFEMTREGWIALVGVAVTDVWVVVVLRLADVVVELLDVDVVVPTGVGIESVFCSVKCGAADGDLGAADAEVVKIVRGVRGAADSLVGFGILLEVVLLKENLPVWVVDL